MPYRRTLHLCTYVRSYRTYIAAGAKVPVVFQGCSQQFKCCSFDPVASFLPSSSCWCQETGTILRRPGSGQASKISPKAKHIIDQQMTKDDESTGMELQKILAKDGIVVSARTALRWRNQLGWTSKGTSYCQMIRDANKEK